MIYSLIIIPKERKRTLPEIQPKLLLNRKQQIKLTKLLFKKLSTTRELDFSMLFDYSNLLYECKVYSEAADEIALRLLQKGIICKSIGGLYDKALVAIHPDIESKITCDKFLAETFSSKLLWE